LLNHYSHPEYQEIDPTIETEESDFLKGIGKENQQFLQEITSNLPGIDEAMSFTEILKLIKNLNYSVVIFDTAPTGHTLRFLSVPQIMEKFSEKFLSIRNRFGGMFSQVTR
jgi:arsenite-transporting ATPase